MSFPYTGEHGEKRQGEDNPMKGAQAVKDLLRIDLLRSIEEPLKYLFLEGKDEAEKDPDDEHRRDTETIGGK
jgi:hypothetical protein